LLLMVKGGMGRFYTHPYSPPPPPPPRNVIRGRRAPAWAGRLPTQRAWDVFG